MAEQRRWETELAKPEPSSPVYLTASTMRVLSYTLGHLTNESEMNDATLDEAINKLCSEWIGLGNARMACLRRHEPFKDLIAKKISEKHRKCTAERCRYSDTDEVELCPVYEW
jgi:hypothetical protein